MTDYHLQLAIIRLDDTCVAVQEGMEGYLATAALEKLPGVEAIFSWLRKRGVRICLLTDYADEQAELLLDRLGWAVGENATVQEVICLQHTLVNPVLTALERAGLEDANLSFTIFDTPRLLDLSNQACVHFNLAVCNGHSPYRKLATSPHHAMLDTLVQLPNFILQHLPEPVSRAGRSGLPKLRLPRPLSKR